MKTVLIATTALAVLTASALSGSAQAVPKKSAAQPAALVCPVTGEKIASIKEAAGHSVYKGKTYYFCCPMCKPKFDKDPAKYVANAAKNKYESM